MIGLGLSLGRGKASSGFDPDAMDYIARVELADGQSLDSKIKRAINQFVRQCKSDSSPVPGISNWQAIKASCLMAGPRTLAGALVPLRGPAPTNYNFVSGDYSPITGLKGNGSTKYLNSNYAHDIEPFGDRHMAAYITDVDLEGTSASSAMGNFNRWELPGESTVHLIEGPPMTMLLRASLSANGKHVPIEGSPGLYAQGREPTAQHATMWATPESNGQEANTVPAEAPTSRPYLVFSANTTRSRLRLSFYSMGASADLVALRSALNTYMEAIA